MNEDQIMISDKKVGLQNKVNSFSGKDVIKQNPFSCVNNGSKLSIKKFRLFVEFTLVEWKGSLIRNIEETNCLFSLSLRKTNGNDFQIIEN